LARDGDWGGTGDSSSFGLLSRGIVGLVVQISSFRELHFTGGWENAKVGKELLGLNIGERRSSAYVLMEELVREIEESELKDSDEFRVQESLLILSVDSVEDKDELWKVSEGILSLTEGTGLGEGVRTGLIVSGETVRGATALQCL